MKKTAAILVIGILAMSMCGCVAILAGTAGGVGTATWLSGKLSKDVNASYDDTIKATESALKSMKLAVTKKTREEGVAQIMSKYIDGKTIWIDIRPIAPSGSRVDIRVGALNGDKEAADKILKRIERYL